MFRYLSPYPAVTVQSYLVFDRCVYVCCYGCICRAASVSKQASQHVENSDSFTVQQYRNNFSATRMALTVNCFIEYFPQKVRIYGMFEWSIPCLYETVLQMQ